MATVTDMGIPGGVTGGILQPAYKNRWRIQMNLREASSGGIRAVTSMAVTADRPKVEYDEITLDRYNSRAYIQGKYTFQPITITLEPDIGGRVHRALLQQLEVQQKLIGPGPGPFLGQAMAGEDYKFLTTLELLNGSHPNSGGTLVLETWVLEGCAINNIDFGDLDYQNSETVKTVITMRYDHAYMSVTGVDKKATGGTSAGF